MLMKRKKRVGTKKRSTKNPIIVKVSLIVIVFFVLFATIFKITELIITHKDDGFPKIEISLKDVSIEEIDMNSKDIKYPNNTVTFTTNNNSKLYENVEIKGRGNSSWTQPKRTYQIKFNEKVNFANYLNSKKAVLINNYVDPSHIRNDIAFYLEKLLDTPHRTSGQFIELYFDNQYHGLYYITNKVELGNSGINLDNPFGILVELDNFYGAGNCDYDNKNNCLVTKEVVNQDNSTIAKEDFVSSINSLYEFIKSKDYASVSETIDIDSFAKYYLLNEFTINPDAYSSSYFMYKNGPEGKIYAGPGWDFDFAIGNKKWSFLGGDSEKVHSPYESEVLKQYARAKNKTIYTATISPLLYDLMEIPEFKARVKEIYQETLSGRGEELLDYIQSQAKYIRNAALRDQDRWKLKTNFDEEVDYLVDWVAKRYDHFEQTYGLDAEQSLTKI